MPEATARGDELAVENKSGSGGVGLGIGVPKSCVDRLETHDEIHGPGMDGLTVRRGASIVALGLIVFGQLQLAVDLFGGWAGLNSAAPIVSGRHPLHVVHGSLGVQALLDHGSTSCFDPSFQAGYPKTPVFDGGCRPAEFVLMLARLFDRHPTLEREVVICKLGLVGVCLLVPIAFALSARGAGASSAGCVLAAMLGVLLWWTPTVRMMFDAGEIDVLLGGLCGIGFCGGLAWYHRHPGPSGWLVLASLTIAGWYSHPLVCLAFFPFAAGYYLSLAPRHGLAWHLGFYGAGAIGFLANLGWLWDWGRYWWLRRPSTDALALPRAEELALAGGWSELPDRTLLGWPMLMAGLCGMMVMVRMRSRTSAWLFGASALATLLFARFGGAWPFLVGIHIERLSLLAVGLAIVPTSFAIGAWIDRARVGVVALIGFAMIPLLVSMGLSIPSLPLVRQPIPLGLTEPQQRFVDVLRARTQPTARIFLDDDITDKLPGWNWTAFLPRLTDRAFIGGLDFGACIELMNCPMKSRLKYRGEFGPADAAAVLERYNIGWIVCRTPESASRWASFPGATVVDRVGELSLIAFDRTHRFVTRGSGQLEHADARRIVLMHLEPDATGSVTVSLHYQVGMRVVPATVIAEPETDPFDPSPMLRLRMSGPVSRVTIVWENP